MWTAHSEAEDRRTLRYRVQRDGGLLTYAEAIHGWRENPDFRAFFNALLSEAPFTAFRWETPPVTTANVGRTFEFVLLDAPSLAARRICPPSPASSPPSPPAA